MFVWSVFKESFKIFYVERFTICLMNNEEINWSSFSALM